MQVVTLSRREGRESLRLPGYTFGADWTETHASPGKPTTFGPSLEHPELGLTGSTGNFPFGYPLRRLSAQVNLGVG